MNSITLSDRLAAVAQLVPRGASVIDVGCDHGYISVWLAQNNIASRITATDLRPGPLGAAKASAEKYGVSDRIEFRLTDGLDGADNSADTVIIAGMGGETIISILERAAWVRENGVLLILQPQSKIAELSVFLNENGFAVTDAQLVRDAGHIYTVFCVRAGKSRAPFACAELYADRLLFEKRDPLLPEYLDTLISKFTRELEGLGRAEAPDPERLEHVRLALDGFMKMKEDF